jgi:glycosyltransferase involved in cell wall biosynthesis
MKIVYSLPHPADKLGSTGAGHTVRATAMLNALEQLGHEIIRLEAASEGSTQAAVGLYRNVVKKMIPRPIAMRMRDTARIAHGRRYAQRLVELIQKTKPNLILETHIAFSLASNIASSQTGIPYMLDDVAPSWEEQKLYGVGLKDQAVSIHRQVTRDAKLLVAVNQSMRRNLIQDGLPEQKIIVIENGIDDQAFHTQVSGGDVRRRYGIAEDAVVIVFVGSFQPYHRVDLLLQAFGQIQTDKQVHLLLVGEGQKSDESKALTTELGLNDRVTFVGRVDYHDVPMYLASGDMTIMPATNEYGNPMKIYEYMALGKVVLAPNQETITEIITHDFNGFLFEKENIGSMARVIKTIIEDRLLRDRLSKQASESASQHTWLKRAQKLQEALRHVGIT